MTKLQQIIISSTFIFSVTPVWALDINCDRTLQFSTLITSPANSPAVYATIPVNSDILMAPSSNKAPSSITRTADYRGPQRARCIVTGAAQKKFNLTVINSAPAITYLYEKGTQTLNAMGKKTVYIGGQLNLALIKGNNYNQPFSIEVSCAAENPNC